jgi:hypothetical protein
VVHFLFIRPLSSLVIVDGLHPCLFSPSPLEVLFDLESGDEAYGVGKLD